MILVLSFFVILFFLFGIFFSKIKINVKNLNFEMSRNEKCKNNFCINFGIFLYGKIKISSVNFENNNIKVFGRKINIEKLKEGYLLERIKKIKMQEINKKEAISSFKNMSLKFEQFNLNLDLGTDSTLITSFLIFVIATIVSLIVKKGVTKYNPNKHSFTITPRYENCNLIKLDLNFILSLETRNIIKTIFYFNKISKKEEKANKNRLINEKKHYPSYV